MHPSSARRAALALLLAAVALPTVVSARDCADAEDQAALTRCFGEADKAADATLNRLYRELEARLAESPDARRRLVTAQRAWIDFRDKECAFTASGVEGGSAYPMVVADCLAGLTEARSERFKTYLGCEEGDLSCPVPP